MSDQLPEVPQAQINSIRLSFNEEMIAHLCMLIAASCNDPSFVGLAFTTSTLCERTGESGTAVVVTMSQAAFDAVVRLMRENGGIREVP